MSGPSKAVFLSYASQDAEAAKRICDALRAAGVEVWFDQSELVGGDAWDQKIRRQIRDCALLIPIISAATQARTEGYFRLEWRLADQRTHLMAKGRPFLLPVVIDDTRDLNAHVPDSFTDVQWTKLPGGETPPTFAARVQRLLSGELDGGRDRSAPGSPRESEPGRREPGTQVPPKKERRWLKPVMAGLVVVVIGGVMARPWEKKQRPAPTVNPPPDATSTLVPVSRDTLQAGAPKSGSPVAEPKIDNKSVAVLAFENLSGDKDNEYFSDGISEELLTVLQKIPGLKVSARTSAFFFKGREATAQEIGAKLGVANLVEGSVRRAGNQIRLTARLSRVATGEQLWSESYTRDLKDIFAVQTELAQAIVGELRTKLIGPPVDTDRQVTTAQKGGTTNAEAHELFLQGKFFANQPTLENMDKAIDSLQRAVSADPSFALAWATLGRMIALQAEYSVLSPEELQAKFVQARSAADRSLALNPDLAEGYFARYEIQSVHDFDWHGARDSISRALTLAPSDAMLISNASQLAGVFGDLEKGLQLGRQAAELDPVNGEVRYWLAWIYCALGRLDEAEVELKHAEEFSPSILSVHRRLSTVRVLQNRPEEALTEARLDKREWSRQAALAVAYWAAKDRPASDAALAKLVEIAADSAAFQVAEAYAFRGETNEAFAWLERSLRSRDPGLGQVRGDPLFKSILSDPRWPAFLKRAGLSDEQLK